MELSPCIKKKGKGKKQSKHAVVENGTERRTPGHRGEPPPPPAVSMERGLSRSHAHAGAVRGCGLTQPEARAVPRHCARTPGTPGTGTGRGRQKPSASTLPESPHLAGGSSQRLSPTWPGSAWKQRDQRVTWQLPLLIPVSLITTEGKKKPWPPAVML